MRSARGAAQDHPKERRRRAAPHHSSARPAQACAIYAAIVVWTLVLAWAAWTQRIPVWALGAAAALNALTFAVYAVDKSAARSGRWRVRETHLHALALLGGWPAAGLAQQWLRHKSRKQEFRIIYGLTVALNCAALVIYLFWLSHGKLHFS